LQLSRRERIAKRVDHHDLAGLRLRVELARELARSVLEAVCHGLREAFE
jgi:hypothetical protein